jgi:PAS domain S-box-containing protein
MTKTRLKPVSEKKKVTVTTIPPEDESGTKGQDQNVPVNRIDALRESEQFLKETQKIVKIGGWKANPGINYLLWTDGIYDIVEAPRTHQPGFNEGLKYFSQEDLPLIRNSIETCLATGKPFTLEVLITTESKKNVWTELRGLRPITEAARTYVIGTFQDITERRRIEDALKKETSLLNAALDSTTDGILVIDTSGKITSYNKTFCAIWGIPPHSLDAADEKIALAYMTPLIADPEKFANLLQEYYSHPNRESFDTVRLTDGRLFERYSKPQKIADTIVGRVWSYRDITERKQAEEAFQKTLQRFYDILSEIRYGILLVTEDDRVEFANRAFCDLFNLPESPADLQNLPAGEMLKKILHSYRDPDTAVARIREIVLLGRGTRGEEVGMSDGRTFLRDFIPLYINEKQFGRLWSHIDITERKQAEEELQKSEARYHLLADNSTDVIWTLDLDGTFTYVSPSAFQLAGWTPEELIHQPFSKVASKGSIALIQEKIHRSIEDVASGFTPVPDVIEVEQLCRDGSTVWAEIIYRLLLDENGKPTEFMGVSRNIAKRKQVEEALQESLEKFRIIATNTPDHILLLDKDFRYSQVINPPLGLAEEDMIGHTDYDILSFEDADKLMKIKKHVMESGTAFHLEIPLSNASGGINYFAGSYVPKRNVSGGIDGLIGYFTDVTEAKQANEKIVTALAEKEILIREIHHRVKNNLQIISGLLDMTRMRTRDPETTGILTDMMMRIKTMALIHTRLYESKQFDKIDMGSHIRDQITDLSSIYRRSGPEIACTVEAGDLFLTVDQAIPCALVVNEVMSNAFKHAFRGRRQGTLRVSAHQEGRNIHIRIEDDGIGIPKDVDSYYTTSLGLKLIRTLVGQLQGTLAIESSVHGTGVTIDFPLKTME